MTEPTISSGGRAPKVADVHVVALYHPDSGKIAHVHTVTVFEGGRSVAENEAVEAAIAHASRMGHGVKHLKYKVGKDLALVRRPHRVDIESGRFVEVKAERKR